jgi:hypothetical protein
LAKELERASFDYVMIEDSCNVPLDYGAKAAGYVDAYMQAIRWDNVTALYDRYSKEA